MRDEPQQGIVISVVMSGHDTGQSCLTHHSPTRQLALLVLTSISSSYDHHQCYVTPQDNVLSLPPLKVMFPVAPVAPVLSSGLQADLLVFSSSEIFNSSTHRELSLHCLSVPVSVCLSVSSHSVPSLSDCLNLYPSIPLFLFFLFLFL